MRARWISAAIFAIVALLALPVGAQQADAPEVVLVDVNLARYDEDGQVTITTEFRNIGELDLDQVVVSQDGVVLDDVEVLSVEESSVRVGVVLVIDVSGSMDGAPLEAAKAAAIQFVNQKREQDSIALVTFASEVELLVPFTDNARAVTARIADLTAEGGTNFFDAIVRSAELYDADPDLQPHIIALTDGADDGSRSSVDEAIAAVTDNEVRVFGIALESEDFQGDTIRQITEASRGLYLATADPEQLDSLYADIRRELNNKVVLRFNATQSAPTDVSFAVQYENLRSSEIVEVPGFVTNGDPVAGGTTNSAGEFVLTPPQPYVVTGDLPAPAGVLRWMGIIGTAIATLGVVWILFCPKEEDTQEKLRRRMASFERAPDAQERAGIFQTGFLRSLSDRAESLVQRRGLLYTVNAALEQANIALRPGEAIALSLVLSVLLGGLVGALSANVYIGVLVAAISLALVFVVLTILGRSEKRKFENQLPDTLTLLATSLRAGYSLLQAIEAVASEAPMPTAREFGRSITEIRLGQPVTAALQGIAERTKSDDFAWAVMAVEIQREVGGNLSEVLNTVADTMLQRNRLRREVKALTAEGRISAYVLASMPFALFAWLFITNREYLEPLLSNTVGIGALAGGLVLMAIGIYWMAQIVDIEI